MEKKEKKARDNRKKGHNGERLYAARFREMGHHRCLTSRYASRMHDDAGIDLVNIPYNVQVKTGRHNGMSPPTVLRQMKEKIAEMFPPEAPERERPSILIHRRDVVPGNRREEVDDIVHLTFADFRKITAPAAGDAEEEEQ